MTIKADFASRLQEVMIDKWGKVNQTQLSRIIGVKQPSVHDWVHGINMPDNMTRMVEIALLFGVCVEWLASGRGPKHPPCLELSQDEKDLLQKIADAAQVQNKF